MNWELVTYHSSLILKFHERVRSFNKMISNRNIVICTSVAVMIALSLLVLSGGVNASSAVDTNSVSTPTSKIFAKPFITTVQVAVIRNVMLNNPSQISKFTTVDDQTIMKYPILQQLMKEADANYEIYATGCSTPVPCLSNSTTPQHWMIPSHMDDVSSDIANALTSDTAFHFTSSTPGIFLTDIRVGTAVYTIEIS
jgi:hypothetical protein